MGCIDHGVTKRRTLLSNFLFHFFLAISVGGASEGCRDAGARRSSLTQRSHLFLPPAEPLNLVCRVVVESASEPAASTLSSEACTQLCGDPPLRT